MAKDFAGDFDYQIFKTGSENYIPEKEMLDFCFTSPPYFDLEKYSDEDSQSYKKFPNRELWLNGYLRTTFENCYHGLKPSKHMAINIADKKGNKLELDTIRIAEEVGFKLVKTLKLALSNINLRDKSKKFKYEPIYIFIK
jgi:DNA modification methylase